VARIRKKAKRQVGRKRKRESEGRTREEMRKRKTGERKSKLHCAVGRWLIGLSGAGGDDEILFEPPVPLLEASAANCKLVA